jgi:hypothetical protein
VPQVAFAPAEELERGLRRGLARAQRLRDDPQGHVDLEVVADPAPGQSRAVGLERRGELSLDDEERDDVGVGRRVAAVGVDRGLERLARGRAGAELPEDLAALDQGLGQVARG